jgi:hypothetical protein
MSTTQLTGTSFQKVTTSLVDNPAPNLDYMMVVPYENYKWIADLPSGLSLTEVFDLMESESEFQQGKGKSFKNTKSAVEWLESVDDEDT